MDIEVIAATEEDLTRLIELHYQSEEFHGASRPDMFRRPEDDVVRAHYRELLQDSKVTVLVAKRNGRLVGSLRYRIFEPPPISFLKEKSQFQAYIDDLTVDASKRRNGIGRLLIATAEKELRAKGVNYVHQNVRPTKRPALSSRPFLALNNQSKQRRFVTDS